MSEKDMPDARTWVAPPAAFTPGGGVDGKTYNSVRDAALDFQEQVNHCLRANEKLQELITTKETINKQLGDCLARVEKERDLAISQNEPEVLRLRKLVLAYEIYVEASETLKSAEIHYASAKKEVDRLSS